MNTNLNLKVTIWLKDGSIFRDWTLTTADIKIDGLPFDIKGMDKIEDAFLYMADGTKIYRDHVTGVLGLVSAGLPGPLNLKVEQVSVLNRT